MRTVNSQVAPTLGGIRPRRGAELFAYLFIYSFSLFVSSAPLRSVSCLQLKRKKKTKNEFRFDLGPPIVSPGDAEQHTRGIVNGGVGGGPVERFLFHFYFIFFYKFFFSLINCINKSR